MMFNSNMTLTALAGNFFFDQDILFEWSATDPDQQKIPRISSSDTPALPINDPTKEVDQAHEG